MPGSWPCSGIELYLSLIVLQCLLCLSSNLREVGIGPCTGLLSDLSGPYNHEHAAPNFSSHLKLAKLPRKPTLARLVAQSTTEPMSKAEIASWISSAQTFDDDEADGVGAAQTPSTPEENWDTFVRVANSALLSSKTRIRVEFLQEKMEILAARGG